VLEVIVDPDVCQGHGECCRAVPDLFNLDGDLVLTWEMHPGSERRAEVEYAADACPVGAIAVLIKED